MASVADPEGVQGVRWNPSPRPMFLNTVNPVISGHSKRTQKLFF